MSKHTPAPWEIEWIKTWDFRVHANGGGDVARIDNAGRLFPHEEHGRIGRSDNQLRADACLIAAAPDLLAELRRSAEGWANALELGLLPQQYRATAEIMRDEARAAIAKAEGR